MAQQDSQNAPKPPQDRKGKPKSGGGGNLYWIYGLILLFILFSFLFLPSGQQGEEITQNKFFDELVPSGQVKQILVVNEKLVEVYLTDEAAQALAQDYKGRERRNFFGGQQPSYTFRIGSLEQFEKKLENTGISYRYVDRPDYFGPILQFMIPILLLVLLWMFFMRRMSGGMGGSQIFNIGKSRASLFDKENKVNINFGNVAGLEEAKQEVTEIVDFLKNPSKFTKLGGHIPKGVLLVGPPGTGKTLLAKAVAGEAGVPFFSLSGSDFVEMFVGVGAARVRDLFKQAKEKAPCIIFIDEIDAIGRSRGRNNVTSGNDERENTLNQLLVEMDGFNTDAGVIIMAATNRPDILDGALLRPGRFDRMVSIDRPDLKEREAIFRVHLKNILASKDIEVAHLAAQTPGFVGADIMNVCNEAALIAGRRNKEQVEMSDFEAAIDRVIGGLEKKNKIIAPEEKKVIAYHEAGHAVSSWFLKHANPLVKVSIIPRGVAALGFAQYLPKEEHLANVEQFLDDMCSLLGGRAAEQIVFGTVSTGAQNDLERVTKMAYAMVTVYGMNEKVGQVSYYNSRGDEMTFTKPYSESLAETIDHEARLIIQQSYERVLSLLTEKREELEKVAQLLLEKEVISKKDIENLIGASPYHKEHNSFLDYVATLGSPEVSNGHSHPESAAPVDVQPVVPGDVTPETATNPAS